MSSAIALPTNLPEPVRERWTLAARRDPERVGVRRPALRVRARPAPPPRAERGREDEGDGAPLPVPPRRGPRAAKARSVRDDRPLDALEPHQRRRSAGAAPHRLSLARAGPPRRRPEGLLHDRRGAEGAARFTRGRCLVLPHDPAARRRRRVRGGPAAAREGRARRGDRRRRPGLRPPRRLPARRERAPVRHARGAVRRAHRDAPAPAPPAALEDARSGSALVVPLREPPAARRAGGGPDRRGLRAARSPPRRARRAPRDAREAARVRGGLPRLRARGVEGARRGAHPRGERLPAGALGRA